MDLDLSQFPNNSNKSRSEDIETRETKSYDKASDHGKKIKGKVITKKKSAARVAAETF